MLMGGLLYGFACSQLPPDASVCFTLTTILGDAPEVSRKALEGFSRFLKKVERTNKREIEDGTRYTPAPALNQ